MYRVVVVVVVVVIVDSPPALPSGTRSICESTMSGVEVRVMSGVLMPELVLTSSVFNVSTTFGKGDVGFGDDSDVSIPELCPRLMDLDALSVLPV